MTPEQIKMVQKSWSRIEPIADTAGDLFYARLFEVDPSLRPMFKGDMREQKFKLMRMIGIVVKGLGDLEPMLPAIENLGRRHNDYGVQHEHYATVGSALLWTLEQGLGDAFDAETREAWVVAYGMLATAMQTAQTAAENKPAA